jgi:hydrogenase maturation protease
VIGRGNTMRGDDGAGPRVVEALARRGLAGVETLAVHQLTPELAERIAGVDRVVFVDARLATRPDEACAWMPLEPARGGPSDGHVCTPGALLALAEWLFGRRPEARELTIPGLDMGFGESLSAPTDRECTAAVEQIASLLHEPPEG